MTAKAQEFLAELDEVYGSRWCCLECSLPRDRLERTLFDPEEKVTYLLAVHGILIGDFLTALVEAFPQKRGDGDLMRHWRSGEMIRGCGLQRRDILAALERLS